MHGSPHIDLTGRIAVVTGAGRGIGRAHALALGERGAAVVLNDVDDVACREVASLINASRGRAVCHAGDVSSAPAADELVRLTVERFGSVDILICNAGIIRDRTFHKLSVEDFDRVVDVHLRGTAYVCHATWPRLREGRYGRVVFTTSSSALWGNFGQANYDAAKLGIVGLMMALKLEGAACNIRVNTIAPFVMTQMGETVFPQSLRGHLSSDTVTALALYLSSDQCAVNGEIFEAGAGRITRVRLQASDGILLPARSGPEDVRAGLGELMAQPTERGFDDLQSAFHTFMRHIAAA